MSSGTAANKTRHREGKGEDTMHRLGWVGLLFNQALLPEERHVAPGRAPELGRVAPEERRVAQRLRFSLQLLREQERERQRERERKGEKGRER
jgi:hypothetical protein